MRIHSLSSCTHYLSSCTHYLSLSTHYLTLCTHYLHPCARALSLYLSPFLSQKVSLRDHCRYQYLVNIGGATYSARLKYLMLCGSPIIQVAAPLSLIIRGGCSSVSLTHGALGLFRWLLLCLSPETLCVLRARLVCVCVCVCVRVCVCE